MLSRFILLLSFGLLSGLLAPPARAQQPFGFEYRPLAKVVQGTDTLRNAWAGGFNASLYSKIDLNADGQDDLYVFDRETARSLTFLNVPKAGGGRAWQYAPDYEILFPAGLVGWVLLRDYDCDARPDLFAYANGDIKVYRNTGAAGGPPQFQLVTNQLLYTLGSTSYSFYTGGYNVPTVQDVNGDGRLDIMSFDGSRSALAELYLNTSTGACGGLSFQLTNDYWGNIYACNNTCTSFSFTSTCRAVLRPNHTGGRSILALDLDNDGDQDLLTGLDNCLELVSLNNLGTTLAPVMNNSSVNSNFPAGRPVRLPTFPAPSYLDVTFDGRPDLVVGTAVVDNSDTIEFKRTSWLYENTSASGAPALTFRQDNFLQGDMLDVSEAAAPAFADLDGDGLKDMLVGSNNRSNARGFYRASLSYFRNVGSATRPVFRLVTSDYLSLANLRLVGMKPVLTDLNRDGAVDLAFSAALGGTNYVYFILNTAPAGQPASFPIPTSTPSFIAGIPYAAFDAPCFTDVDRDGYVDLLLGTTTTATDFPGMALRYYRNTGTLPFRQAFVLVNNDYGTIRTATGGRPGNLHPVVADVDGDGQEDLLTTDSSFGSGDVRLFSNFRAQGSIFSERTDVFYNPTLNQYQPARFGNGTRIRLAPALADLNGDNAPELYIGLEGGGILSFGPRSRTLSTRGGAVVALPLQVYPNPAVASVTIETPRAARVTLLDLTGRVVRTEPTYERRHSLSLQGLAAGVYLVRAESADGQLGVHRLVVR
ncbi:T9SS type A sorting domain-containing protein [Hymenobacter sp. BT175]|uniref:T9SS type A sorting domain-containing protein n=1 Tax=Hymenobacter translucens TaxID=2886507 RepID=UPI001D0E9DDC|nr:T9SS type A sorting domain-containing protein [Hymenobacter translucens]MCC2547285.1 T9SS type A sorting domain-containing protein [Hymenobacter translucens]